MSGRRRFLTDVWVVCEWGNRQTEGLWDDRTTPTPTGRDVPVCGPRNFRSSELFPKGNGTEPQVCPGEWGNGVCGG